MEQVLGFIGPIIVALVTAAAVLFGKRILPKAEQVSIDRKLPVELESASVQTMALAMQSLREEFGRVKADVNELREEVKSVKRVFRVAMKTLERFIVWARTDTQGERPEVPAELYDYMEISNLDGNTQGNASDRR